MFLNKKGKNKYTKNKSNNLEAKMVNKILKNL